MFEDEHRRAQVEFTETLEGLTAACEALATMGELAEIDEVYPKMDRLRKNIAAATRRVEIFNAHERLFGWPENHYPSLTSLAKNFEPYRVLWETAWKMTHEIDEWFEGPLGRCWKQGGVPCATQGEMAGMS